MSKFKELFPNLKTKDDADILDPLTDLTKYFPEFVIDPKTQSATILGDTWNITVESKRDKNGKPTFRAVFTSEDEGVIRTNPTKDPAKAVVSLSDKLADSLKEDKKKKKSSKKDAEKAKKSEKKEKPTKTEKETEKKKKPTKKQEKQEKGEDKKTKKPEKKEKPTKKDKSTKKEKPAKTKKEK